VDLFLGLDMFISNIHDEHLKFFNNFFLLLYFKLVDCSDMHGLREKKMTVFHREMGVNN
jgi:hypothetical protein